MLTNGGSAGYLTVGATPVNGFSSAVSVTVSGLPAGVTATPSTVSVTPGTLQQIALSASGATVGTSSNVTLTGTAGSTTHSATAAVAVAMATPTPPADFSLSAAPSTVMLTNGGSAGYLTVGATPVNGFGSAVSVTVSGLPAGITATPSTVSVTPGTLQQIALSASGATVGTSSNVTLTGTAGSTTHSATAAVAVAMATTTASLSSSSYDFGADLVGTTLTKTVVSVSNTGTADLTLSPSLSGDASYTLASGGTCSATLSAGQSCQLNVSYTPTTASGATASTSILSLGLGNVAAGTAQTVTLTATAAALPAGTVTATNNPQVALYTMQLPYPGAVTVSFGTDTSYGHQTWTQSTATAGPVSIYVAGMLANTTYHMQAAVSFTNGLTAADTDHTFLTGAAVVTPTLTVDPLAGNTPSPGLEQLSVLVGANPGLVVSDLTGKPLWEYKPSNIFGDDIEGAKLMANGHYLVTIGENSSLNLKTSLDPAAIYALREVDLGSNTIREVTTADLNASLAKAGYNFTIQEFHHDVTPLPNGHWIALASTSKAFADLPGYPGVTNVLGDALIDLDENLKPVWAWNEFDHFDVNRHPYNFPDWTHTNAVIYSPTDGNLIVSIRHQNWVVKVDYANGTGAGDVLWRLGEGGDFALVNGVDPTDWQYAQHAPALFTPNSAGVFSLGMMDNGDDRQFPTGVTCGTAGAPACLYSSTPIFQIDEAAKTATLTYHNILDPSLYTFWGGNSVLLANGDFEYELPAIGTGSDVFEVLPNTTTTVWHMHVTGSNAYRSYRIPSLYPGVQY